MNEQKNNGRGIFYGVIGVATLVVAIIGATFAYFTATQSNNNVITGNMATINFGLVVNKVTKADEDKGGMIPMSNSMIEAAVSNPTSDNKGGPCVDNNGNAVCQIYEVTVTNTGTASLFLDGYVTLAGGSGTPTDIGPTNKGGANITVTNSTSMRWAQVFKSGDVYTTAGTTTTGIGKSSVANVESGITTAWASLDAKDTVDGDGKPVVDSHNAANIKTVMYDNTETEDVNEGVTAKGMRAGTTTEYDVINRNYIRLSDHAAGASYSRTTDVTSALVFNQYLDAANAGTTDEVTLYFVVWLTETGTDQTAGEDGAFENEDGLDFFSGNVTFNSAQGSEVTATFSGFAAVKSDATA